MGQYNDVWRNGQDVMLVRWDYVNKLIIIIHIYISGIKGSSLSVNWEF